MRARPLATGAALAGVSVALWAAPAGAGETYDEFNHREEVVSVGGVDCEINMTSYRQGTTVYASTWMQTEDAACATDRVFSTLQFTTAHGDTVSTSSVDEGPISVVTANGAVDLVRSTHRVQFLAGIDVTYSLPK
jgi:hypothetical protein